MIIPSLRDRLLGFNMDSALPDAQLGLVGTWQWHSTRRLVGDMGSAMFWLLPVTSRMSSWMSPPAAWRTCRAGMASELFSHLSLASEWRGRYSAAVVGRKVSDVRWVAVGDLGDDAHHAWRMVLDGEPSVSPHASYGTFKAFSLGAHISTKYRQEITYFAVSDVSQSCVAYCRLSFRRSSSGSARPPGRGQICVSSGARGQGIGRSAVAVLSRLAKRYGVGSIQWHTLSAESAVRFSEMLGAERIGETIVMRAESAFALSRAAERAKSGLGVEIIYWHDHCPEEVVHHMVRASYWRRRTLDVTSRRDDLTSLALIEFREEERLRKALTWRTTVALAIAAGGITAGFCEIYERGEDVREHYVNDVAVNPELRGRGIGRALLRAGMQAAALSTSTERYVASVAPSNVAVQRMNAAVGFTRARVMIRWLSSFPAP